MISRLYTSLTGKNSQNSQNSQRLRQNFGIGLRTVLDLDELQIISTAYAFWCVKSIADMSLFCRSRIARE